jgi:hypothetical protein
MRQGVKSTQMSSNGFSMKSSYCTPATSNKHLVLGNGRRNMVQSCCWTSRSLESRRTDSGRTSPSHWNRITIIGASIGHNATRGASVALPSIEPKESANERDVKLGLARNADVRLRLFGIIPRWRWIKDTKSRYVRNAIATDWKRLGSLTRCLQPLHVMMGRQELHCKTHR